MKTEFYKKVVIESYKDLPKEDGEYIAHSKIYNKTGTWEFKNHTNDNFPSYDKSQWLHNIDWYLLPVDQEQSVQVMPTDEEIKDWLKIQPYLSSYAVTPFLICRIFADYWLKTQLKTVDLREEQIEAKKTWTTETDGEPEPWEVLTDKGIYFDDES